jgi:TolB-like protein/Flp pilus assembly protein TadD
MITIAAVLVLAAGAWAIWNSHFRPPPIEPASMDRMAFPLPDRPSIAVLPFDNMSGDPNQEFFSDGITEDIITALSKTPRLFVIARNSTFIYKGKPVKIQQVAEELGVRYVLEGSVRKSDDKVRVTAQLIDVLKGTHLWAEKYDRDMKDIFAIQDDITREIIAALQVKLTEGEQARIWSRGTQNTKAYEAALESLEYFRRFNPDDVILCRKKAEEAIALDPNYPFAIALLAWSHLVEVWNGWSKSPGESMKKAVELGQKTLTLDENYEGAHSLLGSIYLVQKQWDKAIEAGRRAIELSPNGADANGIFGITMSHVGRREEAITLFKKAIRLNPSSPNWLYHNLGGAQILAGDYQEAITSLKRVIEKNPNHVPARFYMIVAYSLLNQDEKARFQVEEYLKLRPSANIESCRKRSTFKNEADIERVAAALRKAGLPEKQPLPLPDKPSIAVLPFVNMSGDPNQEYFSDGITEEIITALSKVHKLFVIARHSSFTYKGKPIWVPTVGKELGVRYVLEGSVRKAGDKIRITAQLIDAKTNEHLWADRYDRDLKDIFAVQDQITKEIVAALNVELTIGEQARTAAKGTDNLEAYLKFLQAKEYTNRHNTESNASGQQLAQEAVALDPNFSEAHRILGITHMHDILLGRSKSPKESLGKAIALVKKSIELDDLNGYNHAALGFLLVMISQYDKAVAEAERGVALDPNVADIYGWLGMIYRYVGRWEDAITAYEKGIRLNPIPPIFYLFGLGLAYGWTGRYDEGIAELKKAIQIQPDSPYNRMMAAAVYSLAGREEEARKEGAELLKLNHKFSLEKWGKSLKYKNQDDQKRLIGALRRAGLK